MTEPRSRSLTRRVFVNGRERRLRAGWRLMAAALFITIASVAVFLVIDVLRTAVSFVVPLTTGGLLVSALSSQLLSNVLLTGALVATAWFVDRRTLPDLGLGGNDWWPNLGFGLLLGLVMTTVVFATELAAGLVIVEEFLVSRPALGVDAGFPLAFALTALMFVAVGVGEEVLIRGYLMTNLAEGLNGLGPVGPRAAIGTAAALTSALFGVLHYSNPNASLVSAFNISVVGLLFAATYVVTEDLGVPIGIHITWNFSLGAIYGLPVSGIMTPASALGVRQTGDPLVTGGKFGPEAGLVVYLALTVAAGLTWWWVRQRRGKVGFPTGVAVPDLRKSPAASSDSD